MIDFKEEISKYKPILGLDDVESAVKADEMKDVLDLLQYIAAQIDAAKEDKEQEP